MSSQNLDLPRLRHLLAPGSVVAPVGSDLAANSGRWVKLTKDSAQSIERFGLRTSSKSGLSTGVLKGNKGQIKGFVEFTRSPGALLSNPALLAGAAGIMAQVAMQQTMNESTDYLAVIDEKVDDVLRGQKDAVLSRMIGVGFVIDEAMTLRKSRGRVDEVTWSKVQGAPSTIAETQAYALRQLEAVTEKLETAKKVGESAKATRKAASEVQEWLAVLARCFQLQDGIAILELDRVLDSSPEELDGHRRGLREARANRLEKISTLTVRLLDRLGEAGAAANSQVLIHPTSVRQVIESSNEIAFTVTTFHQHLGLKGMGATTEARRWSHAALELRDKAIESGIDGVDVARRKGVAAVGLAKMTANTLSSQVAARPKPRLPRRGDK